MRTVDNHKPTEWPWWWSKVRRWGRGIAARDIKCDTIPGIGGDVATRFLIIKIEQAKLGDLDLNKPLKLKSLRTSTFRSES